MLQFAHTIRDDLGLHARPAGLLVRLSSKYHSQIILAKGEKTADAKKIFSVMALNAKYDDTIAVTIKGMDEAEAAESLKDFLENNL